MENMKEQKSALSIFLDEKRSKIDMSGVITPDIERMERGYSGDVLYKYFSQDRRRFFAKPQIRFTQKSALNDPFELSKRWNEFGVPFKPEVMLKNLIITGEQLLENKDVLSEILRNVAQKKGILLTDTMIASILSSSKVNEMLSGILNSGKQATSNLISETCKTFQDSSEEMFKDVISNIGVFSLSETGINHQMWGLYASSGKGFVVEFNAQHSFFHVKQSNQKIVNSIRQVTYTSERLENFWKNPYYFFLVKNKEWSFECEWRVTKQLTDCIKLDHNGAEEIYVKDVEVGMIKSIYFGYKYPEENIISDVAAILAFDPSIHIKKMGINTVTNELEAKNITEHK